MQLPKETTMNRATRFGSCRGKAPQSMLPGQPRTLYSCQTCEQMRWMSEEAPRTEMQNGRRGGHEQANQKAAQKLLQAYACKPGPRAAPCRRETCLRLAQAATQISGHPQSPAQTQRGQHRRTQPRTPGPWGGRRDSQSCSRCDGTLAMPPKLVEACRERPGNRRVSKRPCHVVAEPTLRHT